MDTTNEITTDDAIALASALSDSFKWSLSGHLLGSDSLLAALPIVQESGKNCHWDVVFPTMSWSSAYAFNPTVPAALCFAQVRSEPITVSVPDALKAKASGYAPAVMEAIFRETVTAALRAMAEKIEAQVLTGYGVDDKGNVTAVGLFGGAIEPGGAYAGISRSTYREWAGTAMGNGGQRRALTAGLVEAAKDQTSVARTVGRPYLIVASKGTAERYQIGKGLPASAFADGTDVEDRSGGYQCATSTSCPDDVVAIINPAGVEIVQPYSVSAPSGSIVCSVAVFDGVPQRIGDRDPESWVVSGQFRVTIHVTFAMRVRDPSQHVILRDIVGGPLALTHLCPRTFETVPAPVVPCRSEPPSSPLLYRSGLSTWHNPTDTTVTFRLFRAPDRRPWIDVEVKPGGNITMPWEFSAQVRAYVPQLVEGHAQRPEPIAVPVSAPAEDTILATAAKAQADEPKFPSANLSERFFLELFSPAQGGGGLRVNNVHLSTCLARTTPGGATVRRIEVKEHVDIAPIDGHGFSLDQAFLNAEMLDYRIVKLSNGASCEGKCHLVTGPLVVSEDGKITGLSAMFEGDPARFSDEEDAAVTGARLEQERQVREAVPAMSWRGKPLLGTIVDTTVQPGKCASWTVECAFLNSHVAIPPKGFARWFPDYWESFKAEIMDGKLGDFVHPILGKTSARVSRWHAKHGDPTGGIVASVTWETEKPMVSAVVAWTEGDRVIEATDDRETASLPAPKGHEVVWEFKPVGGIQNDPTWQAEYKASGMPGRDIARRMPAFLAANPDAPQEMGEARGKALAEAWALLKPLEKASVDYGGEWPTVASRQMADKRYQAYMALLNDLYKPA
jgi:hypothetical protein